VELFGLSPIEFVVIAIVAILVFGQRLPQVAGEAAATLQRVKRALADLRRETGIDQEIYRAKREFEEAARKARALDPKRAIEREANSVRRDIDEAVAKAGTPAATKAADPSAPGQAPAPGAAGEAPPAEPATPEAARPLPPPDPAVPRRD